MAGAACAQSGFARRGGTPDSAGTEQGVRLKETPKCARAPESRSALHSPCPVKQLSGHAGPAREPRPAHEAPPPPVQAPSRD